MAISVALVAVIFALPCIYGVCGYLLFGKFWKTVAVSITGTAVGAIAVTIIRHGPVLSELPVILFQLPELIISYSEIKLVMMMKKTWQKILIGIGFIILKLAVMSVTGYCSYIIQATSARP